MLPSRLEQLARVFPGNPVFPVNVKYTDNVKYTEASAKNIGYQRDDPTLTQRASEANRDSSSLARFEVAIFLAA